MLNAVHKIIAAYLLLAMPLMVAAQQTILTDYVDLALRQNPTLLASQLVENERMIAVELAAANRRLTADFKSDYILSAGGRGIDFPVGDLFNPTYATLNQLTGAEQFPTNLENVNTRFLPSNFHDTRVEARLPLLQPLIGREVALREAQVLEARLATKTLENEVRRQVRNLYFAWLQSLEGQKIIDSSRVVLRELLRVNWVLVDNDKRTADVVYRTEAELADLDGEAANLRQQELLAQAALNRLLARDLRVPLEEMPLTDLLGTVETFDLLSTRARAQRSELEQLDAGTESLVRLEAFQDAGSKPTLGVFLNVGAQGFLNGDFGDHPYVSGGLAFSWNLYDGRKRDLQQQQTRIQREQISRRRDDAARGIELQVWQATQRITNERAQLAAARNRERAAAASSRIVEVRYRNQNALLIEYLDARNQITTAQLKANLARFRLHQAYAALQAALGE
ncbi:MAG: outer membrane protein [Paraglaciecola sp.]|jgi:outer membrane protein TolC